MTMKLDREGTFKAVPVQWGMQSNDRSKSVAVVIEFRIVAQQDGDGWLDWSQYEDHTITGWFYVVKKDGGINAPTVENLARVLGYNGSVDGPAPNVECQIVVENETYNGQERLKVQWLNPADHTPGLKLMGPSEVKAFNNQFGSLLRACATAAKPKATEPPKVAPPARRAAPAPAPEQPAPTNPDDDLPF